jgi:hypothetical protein
VSPVERAALAWWRAHKPTDWSREEHLKHPAVNCGMTKWDHRLALAVARMEKARTKKRTQGGK